MKLSELVGTDLVQAVPLVASAALGHLLFGSFKLGLTASILIGSVPGVFIGARFSSRAPDYLIRPALIVVLLLSGLKLVGVPNKILAAVAPIVDRRRHRLHAVGLAPRQADARCARRQTRAAPRRCRWESPRRRLRPPAPIAATSDEPPQRVAARAAIHRHETGLSSAWNAVVVAPGRVLLGDDQWYASG